MDRRRVAGVLSLATTVVATLLATSVAHASMTASGVRLVYDVYYLAFRVLAVESTTFLEPQGYRAHSHMQTVGPLGLLFPWESRSSAFGAIDGLRLLPGGYQIRSVFRGRSTEVDLEYGTSGSVLDRLSGDFGDGSRTPVPPQARLDTLDPLTAAVAISHALARAGTCTGTQRVFDGVRRYDLSYEDHGETDVETQGEVEFGGRARLCSARVEPLGGFLESGPRAGESPRRLSAWLAPLTAGSTPIPVRLDIEGKSGTLHAYLQEVAPMAVPGKTIH